MKMTEAEFNPAILPFLQDLHKKLKQDEIDFDKAKEALVEYVKKWTLIPSLRDHLISLIKATAQNAGELISKIEQILMVFGGEKALASVSEGNMKDETIDGLLKKISEGISQIGETEPKPEERDPDPAKHLAKHILAMQDDDYLIGHPEWEEIVKDAELVLKEKETDEENEPDEEVVTLYDRMVAKAKEMFKSSSMDDLDFDIEAAIYWLASDYHGGQDSELYSILSTSKFKPGPTHSSVEDEGEIAKEIYDMLVQEFASEIK